MTQIERAIETVIVQSRWLAAPLLLGLVIGLAALLYTFALKMVAFLSLVQTGTEDQAIVGVLKLVDFSLTANLLLIVISSSYENFVARIDPRAHENRPSGLIGIGFSELKHKLLGRSWPSPRSACSNGSWTSTEAWTTLSSPGWWASCLPSQSRCFCLQSRTV